MKNCEYYEKLISKALDDLLTAEQESELREHILHCDNCRAFQADCEKHRLLIRDLPGPALSRQITFPTSGHHRRSWLKSIWSSRITVPVPLAAAMLIIVIASAAFNLLQDHKHILQTPAEPARQIRYVQEIKLAPVTAQIIDVNKELEKKENTL
jgi:anti-sigma factor RsiW